VNITIKDTGSAKNEAETIIGCYNKIDSCVGTMRYLYKQLPIMWNGDQADIADILTKLNNSITYYETKIMPALEKLGSSILAYATATEALANKGNNMSPSEYVLTNSLKANAADAVIVDNEAYSAGERSMDTLTSKIGGADSSRWDTIDTMHSFFKEKGLTDEQISGIIGNAVLESGLDLNAKNPNSTATGLFQWLYGRQPSDWSINSQLEHAWNEMNKRTDINGTTVLTNLNKCSDDVSSATKSFAVYFEGNTEGLGARTSYAEATYKYIKDKY